MLVRHPTTPRVGCLDLRLPKNGCESHVVQVGYKAPNLMKIVPKVLKNIETEPKTIESQHLRKVSFCTPSHTKCLLFEFHTTGLDQGYRSRKHPRNTDLKKTPVLLQGAGFPFSYRRPPKSTANRKKSDSGPYGVPSAAPLAFQGAP